MLFFKSYCLDFLYIYLESNSLASFIYLPCLLVLVFVLVAEQI